MLLHVLYASLWSKRDLRFYFTFFYAWNLFIKAWNLSSKLFHVFQSQFSMNIYSSILSYKCLCTFVTFLKMHKSPKKWVVPCNAVQFENTCYWYELWSCVCMTAPKAPRAWVSAEEGVLSCICHMIVCLGDCASLHDKLAILLSNLKVQEHQNQCIFSQTRDSS